MPNLPGSENTVLPPGARPTPGGRQDETFEEDFSDEMTGLLPDGVYRGKVIDFERGESASGNPQYVWRFLILDEPYAGTELPYWTSLIPTGRWRTVEALEAVGIEASGTIARFKKSDIVGKVADLYVTTDTYKGQERNKIQSVSSTEQVMRKPAVTDGPATKQYEMPF